MTLSKIWVGNSALYGTGGYKFEQNFKIMAEIETLGKFKENWLVTLSLE